MRVIGDKPEGETEIVCPSCKWRLAYVSSDVHLNDDPDEPSDQHYSYVNCPKCQKHIVLPKPCDDYE